VPQGEQLQTNLITYDQLLLQLYELREGNEPITSLLVVGDCPRTKEKEA